MEVLHPRFKKSWFEKMKWERDWINEAEDLFKSIYDDYYKPLVTTADTPQENVSLFVSSYLLCLT